MSKLVTIARNNNQLAAYQQAYNACVFSYKNYGEVMLDFTGAEQISVEGAKVLFGQLLIKDKCGSITCKSLSHRLFVNIARGITGYFTEKFPQGLGTRWGSKIMEPQVEMSEEAMWSTIQLSDEVTKLLKCS